MSEPGSIPPTDGPTRVYFTTAEAAEYVRSTMRHLQKLRQIGGGPVYSKLSHRTVLYRREDLDAWVAEGLRRNTSQTPPEED